MDLSKARPGQRGAIRTILESVRIGKPATSIIAPCGYGKTDIMRVAAIETWRARTAPCSVILSQTDYLRRQTISAEKIHEMMARYRMFEVGAPQPRYAAIANLSADYTPNGECLLSATTQIVQHNADHFARWVEHMIHRHGRPPIFYIDEVDTHSDLNEWGRMVKRLQAAGALIVVLTATPWREDNAPIVGFRMREVTVDSEEVWTWLRDPDPSKIRKQRRQLTHTRYILEADFEWTFSQAWDEGALCHINDHWIDVDLSRVQPGGVEYSHRMLSDLPKSLAGEALGTVVRHPETVRQGCEMLLHNLRLVRRMNPLLYRNLAGIVFCANDLGEESNEHAEQIRECLRQLDPSYKVVIATTADDDGKKKYGAQALCRFIEDGEGDILVVKKMAGRGLDDERIKLGLDLSPDRAAGPWVQRANRLTRPFRGQPIPAHLISPADKLAADCWEKFIAGQGGASHSQSMVLEEETLDRSERDRRVLMVHGARASDVHDTKRNTAAREAMARVLKFLDEFEDALARYTIPEIAAKTERLGIQTPERVNAPDSHAIDTGEQANQLRRRITPEVEDIGKLRFARAHGRSYRGREDSRAYGEIMESAWRELYDRAGVAPGTKLPQIRDLAQLERLYAEVGGMAEQVLASDCPQAQEAH